MIGGGHIMDMIKRMEENRSMLSVRDKRKVLKAHMLKTHVAATKTSGTLSKKQIDLIAEKLRKERRQMRIITAIVWGIAFLVIGSCIIFL